MNFTDAAIDRIHYLAERARFLESYGNPGDAQVLLREAEDLAAALRGEQVVYSELIAK